MYVFLRLTSMICGKRLCDLQGFSCDLSALVGLLWVADRFCCWSCIVLWWAVSRGCGAICLQPKHMSSVSWLVKFVCGIVSQSVLYVESGLIRCVECCFFHDCSQGLLPTKQSHCQHLAIAGSSQRSDDPICAGLEPALSLWTT